MIALFAENYNFNKFSPNSYQTLFRTQNPKDARNASRTTKIRDLGKQRERSTCLLKIEISANSHHLLPKRFFEHKIQRAYATHPGSGHSIRKTFKIVFQSHSSSFELKKKKNCQTIKSHSKAKFQLKVT